MNKNLLFMLSLLSIFANIYSMKRVGSADNSPFSFERLIDDVQNKITADYCDAKTTMALACTSRTQWSNFAQHPNINIWFTKACLEPNQVHNTLDFTKNAQENSGNTMIRSLSKAYYQRHKLLFKIVKNPGNAPQTIQDLLAQGADINATSNRGTILHEIIKDNNSSEKSQTVEELFASIINPTYTTTISDNRRAVFNTLLAFGIDVTKADSQGNTALHINRDCAVAQSLIAYGANVDAKNAKELTPICYTIDNRLDSITTLLINSDATVNDQQKTTIIKLKDTMPEAYIALKKKYPLDADQIVPNQAQQRPHVTAKRKLF